MQQSPPDLLPPIFDDGEALTKIDRCVAALAAFVVDSNFDTASAAEPVQLAEKFMAVHDGI